jgi:hypothetical protein
MTCASCGRRSAPPPEAARDLDLAASALGELDARHRQLTARQKSALTRGSGAALALAIGGSLVAGLGVAERRHVPLALTAVFAVAVAAHVAGRVLGRRRLARAHVHRPPAVIKHQAPR